MDLLKDKQKKTFDTLKENFGYKSVMQTPKIEKVIVSTGVGSIKDKKKIEIIEDRLSKITGQKVFARGAKKSIASFKLREGNIIGYQVTLRGKRMNDFLDRFINIALPRTRDFRGINRTAVDEMGNLTIGVKEHTIFPETTDEELKNVFGLSVTIVTSTSDPKEALVYLESLGFPFKKK